MYLYGISLVIPRGGMEYDKNPSSPTHKPLGQAYVMGCEINFFLTPWWWEPCLVYVLSRPTHGHDLVVYHESVNDQVHPKLCMFLTLPKFSTWVTYNDGFTGDPTSLASDNIISLLVGCYIVDNSSECLVPLGLEVWPWPGIFSWTCLHLLRVCN